ncbi:AAA family ATPase [Mesorhizobium sp. M0074]|uniref:AAA family ATPase n=1 Tax=unclassified Mesorhizobium TaxID=325217 RepID=UPI001FD8C88B|nr:AAA family ATPase [Mesorhizobium sp. LSJC280B00]
MANALFIVMNRVSIGGIGSGPISQLRRRRLLTPLPLRVLHGWAAGFLAKLELYSIIARIIGRRISIELTETLDSMPAVALLGPLQVGKTTLAPEIAERRPSIYLDLESDADRARLAEPELYLAEHQDKLVMLDEVHRLPNLFQNCAG